MGYDVKCYELAHTFISDVESDAWMRNRASEDLAQQIQDVIENFIEYDLVEMRKERGA